MFSLRDMPASPLAFLLEAYSTRAPSLFLVTGPSGSGKTYWCQQVVEHARQQGWVVAGLLAPPVMEGEEKVGIELLDLSSGERRPLATRLTLAERASGEGPAGLTFGCWRFNHDVLVWGNGVLRDIDSADLLIVDELGPLEFRQQQGLQAAFPLLDGWRYRLACVTARPSLVGAVRMRWPWSQVLVLGDATHD
ncbi:MAG TPA: nucleoside-triphosphatase [Candidatus Sulfomarinibacteraceae bacterium]|nr:nucleoside-triphosphatase [Candidatus Sulfomarinibacteraceae bacterium]